MRIAVLLEEMCQHWLADNFKLWPKEQLRHHMICEQGLRPHAAGLGMRKSSRGENQQTDRLRMSSYTLSHPVLAATDTKPTDQCSQCIISTAAARRTVATPWRQVKEVRIRKLSMKAALTYMCVTRMIANVIANYTEAVLTDL